MLTPKERQTYEYIKHYVFTHGYSPTTQEIAEGIQIKSRGVVYRYLKALENSGHIQLLPDRKRNIVLAHSEEDDDGSTGIPVIGRIAAGQPIEAIQQTEHVSITHLLKPNRFILEVCGDSMIGDNICDGDLIICERRELAENGMIVVALIDDQEATLKRIHYDRKGHVVLIPSNPALEPMEYVGDRVRIQGIYIGLLRLNQ